MKFLKGLLAILSIAIFIIGSEAVLDSALLPRFLCLSFILLVLTVMIMSNAFSTPGGQFGVIVISSLLTLIGFQLLAYLMSPNLSDAHYLFSREMILIISLMFLISLINQSILSLDEIWKFLSLITIVPLVMGLVEIFPLLESNALNPESAYHIKAGFAHRNIYAQFLVLTLPVHFVNLFKSDGRLKIMWLVLLFVQLSFCLLLMCRSAWLSLFISIYFISGLFILTRIHGDGKKTVFSIFGLLLPFALFFMLKTLPSDSSELGKIVHGLTHWHYGSTSKRLDIWAGTLQLIIESPFLGHGLGTWKLEILRYISGAEITDGNSIFYQRPHNDFLWIWSESGLFALLAKIVLFVVVITKLVAQLFKSWRWDGAGLVAMLLIYVVISMLSFPMERPELQYLLMVVLAMSIHSISPNFNRSGFRQKWTLIFIALITIVWSIHVGVARFQGEKLTKRAFIEMKLGDWDKAVVYLDAAENEFYNMDAMSTPLSWYTGMHQYKVDCIIRRFIALKEAGSSIHIMFIPSTIWLQVIIRWVVWQIQRICIWKSWIWMVPMMMPSSIWV